MSLILLVSSMIAASEIFDLDSANQRLKGNRGLLRQYAVWVVSLSPGELKQLDGAVAGGDLRRVITMLDPMMLVFDTLCAWRAYEVAMNLQADAARGNVSCAQRWLVLLRRRVDELIPYLQPLIAQPEHRPGGGDTVPDKNPRSPEPRSRRR